EGELADVVLFVRRHLEDHLVVHLQHQAALGAGLLQGAVEAHERDLEDVGGEALDAGVHRLAFAGLADSEVRRRQLRYLAPPAGSTPKMRAAVALWMSWPDANASMSPGSSARWAMTRSSIWL